MAGRYRFVFAAALALGVAAGHHLPALAADVGVAGAVNPDVLGTPPAEAPRTIYVSDPIVFQELIETGASGQTQLIFLDHSTLTVAPNSLLVVDEFVFDPATAEGTLTIEMRQGLVRYVGGKISKGGGVTIETPSATIGIRGGINITQVISPELTKTWNVFGNTGFTDKFSGEMANLNDGNDTAENETGGGVEVGKAAAGELAAVNEGFQGGDGTAVDPATVESGIAANPDLDLSGQPETAAAAAAGASNAAAASGDGTGPSSEDPSGTSDLPTGSDVADAAQTEQTESLPPPDNGPPDPPTTVVFDGLGGRYLATPTEPYTDDFDVLFDEPLEQNVLGGPFAESNRYYGGAEIHQVSESLELRIDTDGDGVVDTVLPVQAESFPVSGAGTMSPLGPLTGTGNFVLHGEDSPFFYYDLETTVGEFRRLFIFGGTPTPDAFYENSTFRVFAYELVADPVIQADLPFTPAFIAEEFPNFTQTDFLIALPTSGPAFDPDSGPFRSGTLWVGFAIEGEGPGQRSYIQVSTGSLDDVGEGQPTIWQGAFGSFIIGDGRPASLGRMGSEVGSVSDAEGHVFYGPEMDHFVLWQNGPQQLDDPNFSDAFWQFYDFTNNPNVEGGFGYRHVANRTEAPDGIGTTRGDRAWNIYAAGLGVSRLPGDNFDELYFLYNDGTEGMSIDPENGVIFTTAADNKIFAGFDLQTEAILTNGTAPSTASWGFGGSVPGDGQFRSAYIDDSYYAANQTFNGGDFDEAPNDLAGGGFRSYFTSHVGTGVEQYFPDTDFCECAFLEWGFWGGEYRWDDGTSTPDNPDDDGPNVFRRERVHMGTWVGGDLPSAAEINGLTGTASYSGHAIATVLLGDGTQYIEAGNYAQTWDFGNDAGSFALTEFDGRNFTGGELTTSSSAAHFVSSTPATDAELPGVSVNVDGSFFAAPGDPAAYVGGTVRITDDLDAYSAIGSFAADRMVITAE